MALMSSSQTVQSPSVPTVSTDYHADGQIGCFPQQHFGVQLLSGPRARSRGKLILFGVLI